MSLPDVDTGRLLGLNYKLICHCKLTADMVRGGIRERLCFESVIKKLNSSINLILLTIVH